MTLFDEILTARGLVGKTRDVFLNPNYSLGHDPFLLPDMDKAVKRLQQALEAREKITIYGDYDIDGLTATTLLLDAFSSFGFKGVEALIPNRFVEGYGMTIDAVEKIAATGTTLIVTVDCGSLSEKEIIRAQELGVDVIVTDHHNVAPVQPPAVAVVNPKRTNHEYPFIDLAGVGVAFKLVQALQEKMTGLERGQEKWLLDLVALGTVCDVVTLVDENRMNVYWGLKVLAKTRRPGLRALMSVSAVEPEKLNARSLGFALGPRMNAAGRLETARISLDLLTAKKGAEALDKAQQLDELNRQRRTDQNRIFGEACEQAEQYKDDDVLVVSGKNWNHGIVGIVAAKLLERFSKPAFVLEEMEEIAKGSARSYGDYSAADAIRYSDDVITKGGGHKLAAGVTLPVENVPKFRKKLNEYYKKQKIKDQKKLLLPKADASAEFHQVDEDFIAQVATLEPFGNGNPEPTLQTKGLTVVDVRRMGAEKQHVKLNLKDNQGNTMSMFAFSAPDSYFVEAGVQLNVWHQPAVNEWRGRRTIESRILHLEIMERD